MKFVAVFLACIVAAQATSYVVPPYDYWCAHSFHVLPARSYYCYTLPVNKNWCTAKFYADCLVEYPKSLEQGCEPDSDNFDALIEGYATKLADARANILLELQNGQYAFQQELDELHATYLNNLKEFLKNVYAEDSDEYKNRVAAYETELLAIRDQALANYGQSITNTMNRIETFHTELLARFRSCLETRVTKLAEYSEKMWKRFDDIIGKYRTNLETMVNKRVEFVVSVFDKLYGDKPKDASHEAGIAAYRDELTTEIEGMIAQFRMELELAMKQFIEKYRCNYKCFFATGCYSFSRKVSSKSCSFPSAPKYSYKMVGVGPFKVDWNGAKYTCLKTCTAAEKTCTFNHQVHIDEINSKAAGHVVALSAKVGEWEQQVADWKSAAEAGLEEKISCMIPRVFCGPEPTQAEIDAFRQKLREQAQAWINQTAQALLDQIKALETRLLASIDSWKVKAIEYVNKVVERFNACVANKAKKIVDYTTCLETRKAAQKAKLVEWLNKAATAHKEKFDLFWVSAFGQAVKDHYHGCVDTKVSDVLAKFEAYWAEWQPQLIEHFTCGLKCTVTMKTPCLNISYKWNFCAPSISMCKLQ